MSDQEKTGANSTAVLAVIVAVIVALLLVGLGYAAFLASDIDGTIKKPTAKESPITDINDLPPSDEAVSSAELKKQIDQLSKDFSKTDNTSDDFSEGDFSNQSLGL